MRSIDSAGRASALRKSPRSNFGIGLQQAYGWLGEPESILLRRLAVFDTSWTAEAAQINGDIDVTGVLQALVDKGLVRRLSEPGDERFHMSASVRELAVSQLAASADEMRVRQQHADYFLKYAERREPIWCPADVGQAQVHDADADNFRNALRWFIDRGQVESSLRVCIALRPYWSVQGRQAEGQRWLEEALSQANVAPARVLVPPALVAFRRAARGRGPSPALHRTQRAIARVTSVRGSGLSPDRPTSALHSHCYE
jgi:predicted ATPase